MGTADLFGFVVCFGTLCVNCSLLFSDLFVFVFKIN